jgi:hypothetical protein
MPFLGEQQAASAGTSDIPHRCDRPSDKNQEKSSFNGVSGEVFLGNVMLALTTATIDDRDPVSFGEAAYSTTEAASHTHQMRVGFWATSQKQG